MNNNVIPATGVGHEEYEKMIAGVALFHHEDGSHEIMLKLPAGLVYEVDEDTLTIVMQEGLAIEYGRGLISAAEWILTKKEADA